MAMTLYTLMSHNIIKFLLHCGVTFTPKLTLLQKWKHVWFYFTSTSRPLQKTKQEPTNFPLSQFRLFQVEDVVLLTAVATVSGLNLQQELLHKGAAVARLGVGVSIPCFFLYPQCWLGQNGPKPPWKQAGQLTAQDGTDWKPTPFAVYLLCYLWTKTCHFLWTSAIGLAGKVTRFDGCSMKIKQCLWKHRWFFNQTAIACWWAHNDSLYLYFFLNKFVFKPRFNY